ncbi:MAG TPA: phosphoribosylformylglycinamidine synthase subunit PurQ [Oscillatoriales cyanobacterium M59_W2019_021]|nr:phosphoribosylformylglycinamidine synthase subunit PurQ [Oscillatoriales cyanobacterium M4454_W2019_049]HIK52716.1 phosphoribosylformylglycinamidine synthase subunit PurQ [Oscillatoriales cyanobacterium M59_W2019_021]
MKFGVIVFPGSNCDRDMAYITRDILAQPTRMIWHQDTDIDDIDVIVIPGGFSYGDYLRCGAIAQFSPVMKSVLAHADRGKAILGICNGFQVLTELGLLPGALVRNRDLHFICDRATLKVERTDLPWTREYSKNEVVSIPIAHGEGCYYADVETLKQLEDNQQVVFRYCTETGDVNATGNPNGSLNNIAGICNPQGNILGMMPHPERAADPVLGSADGLKLFEGLLAISLA